MSRFRYCGDPLFLVAACGYALNRWLLKPWVGGPFLQGYFNDLLLIPAALPVVLWGQRWLGVRFHDQRPQWGEIGLHLLLWSVICEWIGPLGLGRGTADGWDVVAYAIGAVVAGLWWNRVRRREADL